MGFPTTLTASRLNRPPRGGVAGPLRASAGSVRPGVLLLEVVVALGLLVLAMGIIGLIFNNGRHNVELAERMSRAMVMTDRLIAEFDTKLLDNEEREQTGVFGEESVPGMSWKVEVNPSERVQGLLDIDISIYMGDPDGSEDERQLVLETRVQRAEPQGIDFERDFGLDEEQIDQITAAIPGGGMVFDPNNFDPRDLMRLPLDDLVDLLPAILQAFGAGLGQGQLDQIMQAVQSGNAGGQLGGGLPGAGAGGRDQGNGADRPPGRGNPGVRGARGGT
ncbi:MAG: hypothetical protein ACE5E1_01800 [Phycisphaerae bacterium]